MPPSDLQASLDGFAAPHPTDRLFFAVVPPAPVAECIAALARELRGRLGLRGQPRPTTHLHVTLHHLGDFAGVPPAVVEDARLAAAGVAVAPLEARLDRVGSFRGRSGRHPFVLLGEEGSRLGQLHAQLGDRLAALGRGRRERAFVPHVTLLYDARVIPTSPSEAIGWPVHDFVLIHSLLGRTEYRELGRWPLGLPQQ